MRVFSQVDERVSCLSYRADVSLMMRTNFCCCDNGMATKRRKKENLKCEVQNRSSECLKKIVKENKLFVALFFFPSRPVAVIRCIFLFKQNYASIERNTSSISSCLNYPFQQNQPHFITVIFDNNILFNGNNG